VRELATPVYVLTAWNPGEERSSEASNGARNIDLWETLVADGRHDVLPAVGRSPDGDHAEESWAVTRISERRARRIGREFGQWAIFKLTLDKQVVVGCDAAWFVERPIDERDWIEEPLGVSLHEVVAQASGTIIVNDALRFHQPGWQLAGCSDLRCWTCGGALSIYVADLISRAGLHYGAAVAYCPSECVASLPPSMPASHRRAVLAFRDYALARVDGDALGPTGENYSVYVIELDRKVLQDDGASGVVYVGQTSLSPEVRFQQHKVGQKSSRWVRKHGVALRPDLYGNQPALRTKTEALTYERYVARRLESEGWTVKGGH
jgi:hypothetical protein